MNPENSHQIGLRNWICAGLAIGEIRALNGDAGYIFSNMIAKYSLYNEQYLISVEAENKLNDTGIDLGKPIRRGLIYGKDKLTIFEHAIPAKVVRQELLLSPGSAEDVRRILARSGPVAILTRQEDRHLSSIGLSQSMPQGWMWGDDELARYHVAGIALSKRSVSMTGAVKR